MLLKWVFKIIIFGIILFGIGNYLSYLHTGSSPSFISKTSELPDIDIPEIKRTISEKIDSIQATTRDPEKTSQLYKWRDKKGVIHYTSEQPVDVENVETITYHSDTNVVPAVRSEINEEENTSGQAPASSLPTDMPENVYSPEGIKELIDQAKNVQNQLNEHYENQEERININ